MSHLPVAPHTAGYSLYCGARHIRRPETVYALREAAREDRDFWGRYYSIHALCVLTRRSDLGALASSLLADLLEDASVRSRVEVASALRGATDQRTALLRRLADDPSEPVREAAAASLLRSRGVESPG